MKEILNDPKKGLSYFWSAVAAYFIGYILYRWGHEKEILTLIIGLIGGTILGSIFGLWFAASYSNKHPTHPEGTVTNASIEVTQVTGDSEDKNIS